MTLYVEPPHRSVGRAHMVFARTSHTACTLCGSRRWVSSKSASHTTVTIDASGNMNWLEEK